MIPTETEGPAKLAWHKSTRIKKKELQSDFTQDFGLDHHRNLTSDEGAFRRRWASPTGLVQKVFNILDTFPFTNYTYRGIIISIQPKLKNFVK